jgi:hypothetical protein
VLGSPVSTSSTGASPSAASTTSGIDVLAEQQRRIALVAAQNEELADELKQGRKEQVLLSDRFLFVYGGYDPWTTAAFEVGVDTDSARYVAPGLNHSALLIDLADDDKAAAFAALGRWLDVDVAAAPAVPAAHVARWRRHLDDERAWLATRVGLRPGL